MIGQTVSHYKILEKLGEGGMGVVYKAHDTTLDRDVALKFLSPHLTSDPTEKERFYHEARAAAALTHPNIAVVHEIGEHEEQLFIAMEFVEGTTLKQLVGSETLSVKKVLDIAIQVCEGLAAAHEKGIVHRDIKSENIIVTAKGQAKIMDFGLAKVRGATRLTQAGSTPGTAAYMSPEQAQGEEVDNRSDIFSFGVVLYELLTGRLPFRGEHEAALMYSIVNQEPSPLARFNEKAGDDLQRIVSKALAKDREERYQHADELATDLKKLKSELEAAGTTPRSRAVQPEARQGLKKFWVPSVIIAVLVVAFFLLRPVLFGGGPIAAPKPIAVISFTNQTGDPSYDYLQEVIPNLLITSLEQSKYLSVVTWERLQDLLEQMGRKDVKLIDKETGFELCQIDGIDTIVLGSYSKAGDVFVTDVKVLNVRTKELLKSASTRGAGVGSILQTQIDDLGRQISRGVGLSERKVRESPPQPIAEVTTTSIEAYNYFLRGRDEWNKFYPDDARRFLEKAVALDSTFAVAHLCLGIVYNALRSVKAAQHEYEKAMALSQKVPEKERLYIEARYALDIERDEDKRVRILTELVTKYPKEKQAHFELAAYFLGENRFDEAERECTKALELDPNFGPALNILAYAFAGRRDYEKAIQCFEKYASASPGDANPYDSMGDMYFRMGKLDEAIAKYKEALEVKPDWDSQPQLAYIYALKEDYTESMRWLDRFIAVASTPGLKGHGYSLKALYSAFTGRWNESLDYIRKEAALLESAENPLGKAAAAWDGAWTSYEMGDYESSRRSFRVARDVPAGYRTARERFELSVYAGTGEILLDLKEGKLDSAKAKLAEIDSLIRDVKRDQSEHARVTREEDVAKLLAAEICLAADSVEKAIAVVESRSASEPPFMSSDLAALLIYNTPPERDVLARCYQKIGAFDKAIAEYERLSTFDPQGTDRRLIYPRYHYRLARLCEDKGRVPEAVAQYKKFLDICGGADKGMTEVADARARLARLRGERPQP
jgi:serine/threonine protein kinase/Tfp pilus assembly protein PilF